MLSNNYKIKYETNSIHVATKTSSVALGKSFDFSSRT